MESVRVNDKREEDLLALGEIFEVLGKHSYLLENPEYARLILDYLKAFSDYAPKEA